MLIVKSSSIKNAWRESVLNLFNSNDILGKEVFKEDVALIQIEKAQEVHTGFARVSHTNISPKEYYDTLFPMTKDEIDAINEYIVSGRRENEIAHNWTKLYRKRLFEDEDQINHVIEYLKKDPRGKRGQITIWKNQDDINAEIAPCLQLLWFQIENNNLIMHVHMRASDCYGKLLMNINEFHAIQRYIADKLTVDVGDSYIFIDSCHFYIKDKPCIEEVIKILSAERCDCKKS